MDLLGLFSKISLEAAENYPFDECETVTDPTGMIWGPDVVHALVRTNGNIGKASQLLQRSRSSIKRYIEKNVPVQEGIINMRESVIDDAEEMQALLAKSSDGAAGRFILSTIGKDRGYITRAEHTGKDGIPIQPASVDFSKMSTKALLELDKARKDAEEAA